jgi:hypothetical protein
MTPTTIVGSGGRERASVLGIAALVVVAVAVYLALKSSALKSPGEGNLLPYQQLVATLVSADQTMFADLSKQMVDVEEMRAAAGQWPGASRMTRLTSYTWTASREGYFLNYLATPADDQSAAGWLLVIQEPDPQAPVDPAPNDETHHRLPDGTVLHVSIWTHRFGGQIDRRFVRQPERSGWTQVLTAPVPPTPAGRK